MKKQYFISVLFFINSLIAFTQEAVYFNHIYNPISTYASGRGILQVDSNYYGIFGTWEAPEYYYKLGVFEMDLAGNLINWSIVGEDGHDYFAGSVGGTLIKTNDGNFAFACQVQNPNAAFGKLIKLNPNLDTIWTRSFYTDSYITGAIKVKQAADGGYVVIGRVIPEDSDYYNLLLLRANIQGNELWYQTYGGEWSENGTDVIETPDGGYLIGGYFWKPGYDHSLDAMVIKTDSLGNEEWTKFYGNPTVDDDMALVAMADDGNYLVTTVYGEWTLNPYNGSRAGRLLLDYIDIAGNTIWAKKIGPTRFNLWIKNMRKTNDGYIITGFSFETDSVTFQHYTGWMMKLNNNLDSIWYRDYLHQDETWDSFFYDAYPTSDNGYIAVGYARPDMGGNNKMWVVKVDSMGCDTPGCATGVQVFDIPADNRQELWVWPNPAHDRLIVTPPSFPAQGGITGGLKNLHLYIYNSQGVKVEKVTVRETKESISINCMDWQKGLYLIRLGAEGINVKTAKIIVH